MHGAKLTLKDHINANADIKQEDVSYQTMPLHCVFACISIC